MPVILTSLIVGILSGGAAGFFTATLFSGSFSQWLSNPLGFKINNSKPTGVNENKPLDFKIAQSEDKSENEESSSTQAVAKVSPAVVSIVISKELRQYNNNFGSGLPFPDIFNFPFDQFFNMPNIQPAPQAPTQPSSPSQKQKIGGGTGFIITTNGLIATNKHVVEDAEADYSVVMSDGKTYDAKVVARDPLNDVAFIKIEADNLPIVTLGDSAKLKIGQTVLAIGFSLGEYSNSVTKGIISGINRDIVAGGMGTSENLQGVIQTDAAINPGNSGGPLINLAGEVIGINTAINQSGQLVGFALPINNVKQVIETVKAKGKIVRPYLGVRYVPITADLATKNKLPYKTGVLIVRGQNNTELAVVPGSPANKAGLVENDIILEINGIILDQNHLLAEEITKHQPGDLINLKVFHQGSEKTINLELAQYPE